MVTSATLPQANTRTVADDDFVLVRNVPIFSEHRTTAKNGRLLVFGYRELKAVCDRCNRRIQETGDYAAITIGHTPDPALVARGTATVPPVVGYAGPFQMGFLGHGATRKYCILADMRFFKSDWATVRRHPRRSPELWLENDYQDMFLDPIALLGAEAPRLDMGLLYSFSRHKPDGRTVLVEKYAAACASPTSVFTKSDKYAAEADPQPQGGSSMLSQDDVGQIVDALMQTQQMQWVTQQMGASQAPQAGVPQPDLSSQPPATPLGGAQPAGAVPGAPTADMSPPPGGAVGAMPPQAAGGQPPPADRTKQDQAMAARYAADQGPDDDDDDDDDDDGDLATAGVSVDKDKESYRRPGKKVSLNRLQRQFAALQQQNAETTRALEVERAKRIDAERYSKLQELVSGGVPIDPEREMKRLCYAKQPSEEAFADSLAFIEEHAQRLPMGIFVPTPELDGGNGHGREKYSKEHSDRARQICEAKAMRGESPDYTATLAEVRAGKAS